MESLRQKSLCVCILTLPDSLARVESLVETIPRRGKTRRDWSVQMPAFPEINISFNPVQMPV
jgi:hypothetical protein